MGKGGLILTTGHPRNGFDCCRITATAQLTAGAGDGEIANEFDEMKEELTTYAKCEFRGYQQLIPGARGGNSESTSHTLRQGGLYFRETPWNKEADANGLQRTDSVLPPTAAEQSEY